MTACPYEVEHFFLVNLVEDNNRFVLILTLYCLSMHKHSTDVLAENIRNVVVELAQESEVVLVE